MSKIQEKLDSLRPYVVGIRYVQGVQLIDAVFKDGWAIPESDVITKEKVDGAENYYMFFSDKEDVDIDTLLDYVEGIIGINIEREKKHELLKDKVKELQKIFKDSALSKLQRLRFTFGEEELVPSLLNMDVDLDEPTAESIVESTTEKVEDKPATKKPKAKRNGKTKNVNGQKIELPPKDGKIELESHDLPKELTEGECDCGEDEACPKCMDTKALS